MAAVLTILFAAVGMTSCGGATTLSRNGFLLDTVVTVTLYRGGDEQTLEDAFALCEFYEEMFSRTSPDSVTGRLNRQEGQPMAVPEEVRIVLERAVYFSELSGGKFDVTICPVAELWNFSADSPEIPEAAAISRELEKVDYRNITLQGDRVTLTGGAQIDLGGIAKGYIADKIATLLRERGVESAIINLGGNIVALGEKSTGTPFLVGIQKPFEQRNETIGTVEVADRSVVSSGIYERCFRLDGTLYHHILDPVTGYPAETGLTGVTVIAESSMDADALSTTLFLLGADDGLELVESLEGVEAVLITDTGEERFSSGFRSHYNYSPDA